MSAPWMVLEEQLVHDGYRKIARRTYRLPDGGAADFEIRLEPRVVAILALDEARQVILARQYRPGPDRILLEIPGGGVEPGETPEQAARRELLEETGCEGDLRFIGESLSGAYTTMLRFNFVALNCRGVGRIKPDPLEFIEVVRVSLDDFRALLRSGQLSDVATGYMGLDFLGLL
jgi:ADP-ribose pyrophosphatase